MKNPFLSALVISLITGYFTLNTCETALAQVPQGIPYQAIARNASGAAIANTAVKVRFSIRDSIATGAIRYQETQNPTTSAMGLFAVNVGMGTVVSGTFSGINWGKNAKFLQVELDPAGGVNYTDLGTTQMMSVPYALYAGQTLLGPAESGPGFTMISMFSPTLASTPYYTLMKAIDYCFSLTEGGYSDWRLPTLDEYISFCKDNGPYETQSTPRFSGWTSTPSNAASGSWWFINSTGSPDVYSSNSAGSSFGKIKCVR